MPLIALVRAARAVGVRLTERRPGDDEPHLYVWTTPSGEVLYIGKAADPRRTLNEEGWASAFDPTQINVGFVVLIQRHKAERHDFNYEGVEGQTVLSVAEGWSGPALDALRSDIAANNVWSLADAEMILIRMAVLGGYPTANSSGAGQWEQMMGDRRNTLAAIAVEQDPELSLDQAVHDALNSSPMDPAPSETDEP